MVGFFRFDHLRVRPLTLHVLQWGSFFNPGRSFALYLAHLGEACQLRSIPHYWYMAALRGVSKDISLICGEACQLLNIPHYRYMASARGVAKGLENAHDLSIKLGNYIPMDLSRMLIDRETLSSENGRISYMP